MRQDIPIRFLPKEELSRIEEFLRQRAKGCISQEKSETELVMKISGTSFVTITTNYKVADFGFGPNELVMFPDNMIGLSVGITHDSSYPQVWFVSDRMLPGVVYWPGANNPDFFRTAGFARVRTSD